MDLADTELSCCVVTLSEGNKSVSCSGVIIHPQSGTIICTGLPFSRFIANKTPLNANDRVLAARRFSKNLQIQVTSCAKATVSKPTQTTADLRMLVNCLEFRQAFQSVFPSSQKWRFYSDESEEDLLRDAQFLSWFAVLKARDLRTRPFQVGAVIPWQDSSSLCKGCPVVACGTPFGSLFVDLFTSTLSKGIISNLTGQENAVILTDARCLPGTEGGGLFTLQGKDKVSLVGVVVSPFGWKSSEWIGLSLVCSVRMIFKNLLKFTKPEDPLLDVGLREKKDCMVSTTRGWSPVHPTVGLVDSGQFWGSGVLVSPLLVLTCRHVVNGKSTVMFKFHQSNSFQDVPGDVVFSTQESSPYDLAVVRLRDSVGEVRVPHMSPRFDTGEPVLVVGYGAMGRSCGPSLTSGVLSKCICSISSTQQPQPVMLQTTCAVQAGTSGGAVIRPNSSELLGIVSSNTKDFGTNTTYPHLNFCIPVTVFQSTLVDFSQTQDLRVFTKLDQVNEDVRRVWRLQTTRTASKL